MAVCHVAWFYLATLMFVIVTQLDVTSAQSALELGVKVQLSGVETEKTVTFPRVDLRRFHNCLCSDNTMVCAINLDDNFRIKEIISTPKVVGSDTYTQYYICQFIINGVQIFCSRLLKIDRTESIVSESKVLSFDIAGETCEIGSFGIIWNPSRTSGFDVKSFDPDFLNVTYAVEGKTTTVPPLPSTKTTTAPSPSPTTSTVKQDQTATTFTKTMATSSIHGTTTSATQQETIPSRISDTLMITTTTQDISTPSSETTSVEQTTMALTTQQSKATAMTEQLSLTQEQTTQEDTTRIISQTNTQHDTTSASLLATRTTILTTVDVKTTTVIIISQPLTQEATTDQSIGKGTMSQTPVESSTVQDTALTPASHTIITPTNILTSQADNTTATTTTSLPLTRETTTQQDTTVNSNMTPHTLLGTSYLYDMTQTPSPPSTMLNTPDNLSTSRSILISTLPTPFTQIGTVTTIQDTATSRTLQTSFYTTALQNTTPRSTSPTPLLITQEHQSITTIGKASVASLMSNQITTATLEGIPASTGHTLHASFDTTMLLSTIPRSTSPTPTLTDQEDQFTTTSVKTSTSSLASTPGTTIQQDTGSRSMIISYTPLSIKTLQDSVFAVSTTTETWITNTLLTTQEDEPTATKTKTTTTQNPSTQVVVTTTLHDQSRVMVSDAVSQDTSTTIFPYTTTITISSDNIPLVNTITTTTSAITARPSLLDTPSSFTTTQPFASQSTITFPTTRTILNTGTISLSIDPTTAALSSNNPVDVTTDSLSTTGTLNMNTIAVSTSTTKTSPIDTTPVSSVSTSPIDTTSILSSDTPPIDTTSILPSRTVTSSTDTIYVSSSRIKPSPMDTTTILSSNTESLAVVIIPTSSPRTNSIDTAVSPSTTESPLNMTPYAPVSSNGINSSNSTDAPLSSSGDDRKTLLIISSILAIILLIAVSCIILILCCRRRQRDEDDDGPKSLLVFPEVSDYPSSAQILTTRSNSSFHDDKNDINSIDYQIAAMSKSFAGSNPIAGFDTTSRDDEAFNLSRSMVLGDPAYYESKKASEAGVDPSFDESELISDSVSQDPAYYESKKASEATGDPSIFGSVLQPDQLWEDPSFYESKKASETVGDILL